MSDAASCEEISPKYFPAPPRMTVRSLRLYAKPARGPKLLVSDGRFAFRNGRNSMCSENTPVSRSYRTPRFSVSRFLMFQSSCTHPAYTFRGTFCFQSPTPRTYFREIEESDA